MGPAVWQALPCGWLRTAFFLAHAAQPLDAQLLSQPSPGMRCHCPRQHCVHALHALQRMEEDGGAACDKLAWAPSWTEYGLHALDT